MGYEGYAGGGDGEGLVRRLMDDPGDWLARLAYADWLEEQGLAASSLEQRGVALRWAWAGRLAEEGWGLCFVEGRGVQPLIAHFCQGPPAALRFPGWEEPFYYNNAARPEGTQRVIFESHGHDVPANLGRQRTRASLSVAAINGGRCPWLLIGRFAGEVQIDSLLPRRCQGKVIQEGGPGGDDLVYFRHGDPVSAGASPLELGLKVSAAGGWWLPAPADGP
jgi:uncharacterized protein (TIGR02996 family)